MKLPDTLRAEIKRVARDEESSTEELVAEIARLTNYSTRQIYNFGSGKWPLPALLIPILCKRFGSRALLNALTEECIETRVAVPQSFDLTREVSMTVREDLGYYEEFLRAFESDGIQPEELATLLDLMERVVRNAHRFLEIASADCERRQEHNKSLRFQEPGSRVEMTSRHVGPRGHHER